MDAVDRFIIVNLVDVGDGLALRDPITGSFLTVGSDKIQRTEPSLGRKAINGLLAFTTLLGAAYAVSGHATDAAAADNDCQVRVHYRSDMPVAALAAFVQDGKIPAVCPGEELNLTSYFRVPDGVELIFGPTNPGPKDRIQDKTLGTLLQPSVDQPNGFLSSAETTNLSYGVYPAWVKAVDRNGQNSFLINVAVIPCHDSLERLATLHTLDPTGYRNLEQMLPDIGDAAAKVAGVKDCTDVEREVDRLTLLLARYNYLEQIYKGNMVATWVYGCEKVKPGETHNRDTFGTNTVSVNLSNPVLMNYLIQQGVAANLGKGNTLIHTLSPEQHVELVYLLQNTGQLEDVIGGGVTLGLGHNINADDYKGKVIAETVQSADSDLNHNVVVSSALVFRSLSDGSSYDTAVGYLSGRMDQARDWLASHGKKDDPSRYKVEGRYVDGNRISTTLVMHPSKSPTDTRDVPDVKQGMDLNPMDLCYILGSGDYDRLMQDGKLEVPVDQPMKDRLAHVALRLYSASPDELKDSFPGGLFGTSLEKALNGLHTVLKATDGVDVNREVYTLRATR
ncbi:MAG: hypothetical protein ABIJ08_04840 [Nanoarchaeota archaeon]